MSETPTDNVPCPCCRRDFKTCGAVEQHMRADHGITSSSTVGELMAAARRDVAKTIVQPATDEQVGHTREYFSEYPPSTAVERLMASLIARIEADREENVSLHTTLERLKDRDEWQERAVTERLKRVAAEAREKALTEALTDARSYIVDERDRFVRAVCSDPPTPEESEHLAGISASLARVDAALSQTKGGQA